MMQKLWKGCFSGKQDAALAIDSSHTSDRVMQKLLKGLHRRKTRCQPLQWT
jgi:hypothetical protein